MCLRDSYSHTIILTMKSITCLFCLVVTVMIIPRVSHGGSVQANAGFCQDAQTTADLVACSARHLDAENTHMKILYDHLTRVLPDEARSGLGEDQKAWIARRDILCATESAAYAGGSLARVQELSCLARVTGERSRHLEALLIPYDRDVIPTFSAPARWTNVLIHDYPQTYWALAAGRSADTDCDGTDEIVVTGLKVDKGDTIIPVTAIVDQDKTGRPRVSILNFEDHKNCGLIPALQITPAPVVKPDMGTGVAALQCKHIITLKTRKCGDFILSLDRQTDSYTVSALDKNRENEE